MAVDGHEGNASHNPLAPRPIVGVRFMQEQEKTVPEPRIELITDKEFFTVALTVFGEVANDIKCADAAYLINKVTSSKLKHDTCAIREDPDPYGGAPYLIGVTGKDITQDIWYITKPLEPRVEKCDHLKGLAKSEDGDYILKFDFCPKCGEKLTK